jgi:hypothetical protein
MGTNYIIDDNDIFDLYTLNAIDILRKIRNPIPFCRYCAYNDGVEYIPWGNQPHKAKVSDWIIKRSN